MDTEELNTILLESKKITVLYVINNENNINNNLKYFENIFKKVVCVNSAQIALDEFINNKYELVITDIDILDFSGFRLIEEIKKININTICIIYTDKEDKDSFLKTIELSIDGYILKPLNEIIFLKTLEKSLNKYNKKLENRKIKKDFKLLKQYHETINKSTIVSKTNKLGIITYANKNFCKVSEYSKLELIGSNHNIIKHPDNPKELFDELWNTISIKKKEWTGIIKNLSKSGQAYYVKTTIRPILDSNNKVVEYIAVRNNISTVMSDKNQLIDKIQSGNLSILTLVQIEEFEILDKFYNISTVDKIEKMFAYDLLSYLPNGYVFENIYNIGNGRFALLTDFFDYAASETNINEYLELFIKNIKNSTLVIDEIEYDLNIIVSYSFGKENLYEDAKCGLDEAFKQKEIIKCSNDSSIKEHIEAKKNMEIIKMVKIALDNYKIVSYFQPIINNKTKEIEKYESLVRLVDENGKVISPYTFLDVSKKGNYYNKITHRVLENSFKMLDHITTKISINLSSLDIEKIDTQDKLFSLLSEYEEHSSRIIFEILEDEDVKDFNVIKRFIKKVKKMGVQIAIDDFGAGYSNFERLLTFEPDILKIDGSLVKNIVKDKYSKDLIETIVSFAKKQGIQTVAEFVENEEIFNILHSIGVDYSQGYYFGKPENINIPV